MQNNQEGPSLDFQTSLTVAAFCYLQTPAPWAPQTLCFVYSTQKVCWALPEIPSWTATWKPSLKQKAEAIAGLTLFISHHSDITVLCGLMSTVLKSIVSYIFPFFLVCFSGNINLFPVCPFGWKCNLVFFFYKLEYITHLYPVYAKCHLSVSD